VGDLVRIFPRGRFWWANYQLGGRQHRRSLGTASKKEARRKALLLEAELLEGRHKVRPRPPAVDAAVEEYLGFLRAEGRAAKTMAKYGRVLERLAGLLRDRRAGSLMDLDLRAVDAYRRARAAAGAAPKTIYTETVIVRQLVNFALSRGLIAEDPLHGQKVVEPKPRPQPCWAAAEVERVLAASPESHRPAFTILADTGMRFAELAHLTWDDVDFGRNVLHVRAKEGWRPKTGDRRAIPMTARTRAALEGLPRRGRWVVTAPPSPRYPRVGRQVSERRLLGVLKRVLGRLSLEGHLHTFRHAFISTALTKGVPEAVVREWVGHVDRDIMKLYTHIASEASQAAMRRFAGEAATGGVGGEPTDADEVRDPVSARIQHTGGEVADGPSAK
jgi:site-specific recombinase XerD